MESSSSECCLRASEYIAGISIKTLSGITGFRTTKNLPALNHTSRKKNVEKSWQVLNHSKE
jgi:hypothetical protein